MLAIWWNKGAMAGAGLGLCLGIAAAATPAGAAPTSIYAFADNKHMFVSARQVADPDRLAQLRPDLPVYVVVGDAVAGGRQQLCFRRGDHRRYRPSGRHLPDARLSGAAGDEGSGP